MKECLAGRQLDVVSRCCDFILMLVWVMGGAGGVGRWGVLVVCAQTMSVSPKGASIRVSGMLGHSFLIETWEKQLPGSHLGHGSWQSSRHGDL